MRSTSLLLDCKTGGRRDILSIGSISNGEACVQVVLSPFNVYTVTAWRSMVKVVAKRFEEGGVALDAINSRLRGLE